jgi:hypothetical protein
MSSMMKKTLLAALKTGMFEGDKLTLTEREYLRRLVDDCTDDPIWEKIVADARACERWPPNKIHSSIIYYALEARKIAESVKRGNDPILLERQKQRAELFDLAEKAEALARYFKEAEKYSGIAMYFQRFLVLPVLPGQEAVARVEPPFLRVKQLQELHLQEAKLLRQSAGREPKHTTFISRNEPKRHVAAFIHLMTNYMKELCGKKHRHAVALLASMAFNCVVDDDDVYDFLRSSSGIRRKPGSRAFKPK